MILLCMIMYYEKFDYYLKTTNNKIFVKCANPKKIMDLHLCFYK